MAQTAKKLAPVAPAAAPVEAPRPSPVLADRDASALDASPALQLQAYLADALEDEAPIEGKWSPRTTLAFVAVSCGLLWAVVLGGLAILT